MVTAASLTAAGFARESARDYSAKFGGIGLAVCLDAPDACHGRLTITAAAREATQADYTTMTARLDLAGFRDLAESLHSVAMNWQPPPPNTRTGGRFELVSDVRITEFRF